MSAAPTHLPSRARQEGSASAVARWLIGVFCASAIILPTHLAISAEFQVSSHTVGQIFEYVRVDGETVPHQRFTERLSLNGWDLLGDGQNQLRFVSSMRFDTNLGLVDEDRGLHPALDRRINQVQLQYAYLEGRRLSGRVDLKLGRFVHSDVLGWIDLDGGWASARIIAGLFVEAIVAVEVKQDVFVMNNAAFDPDGTDPLGPDADRFDAPVIAYGAGIGYRWSDHLLGRVVYRRHSQFAADDVEQERVGGEVWAHVWRLSGSAGAAWNMFVQRVERADVALDVEAIDDLVIGAEAGRRVPVFDADSIFNVFELRAHDHLRLRARWVMRPTLTASLRGGAKLFGEDRPGQQAWVVTTRGAVGWSPWPGLWTRASHQTDIGVGGRKHYSAISATSPQFYHLVEVSAAFAHLAYTSDHRPGTDGHGFAGVLGTKLRLGELGNLDVTLEQTTTPYNEHEIRVLMLLDLDLWI